MLFVLDRGARSELAENCDIGAGGGNRTHGLGIMRPLSRCRPRVAGGDGKWRQVAGYIGWKKGYGKALSAPNSCLRSCFHGLLKQKVTTSHYKGFRLTRTVNTLYEIA